MSEVSSFYDVLLSVVSVAVAYAHILLLIFCGERKSLEEIVVAWGCYTLLMGVHAYSSYGFRCGYPYDKSVTLRCRIRSNVQVVHLVVAYRLMILTACWAVGWYKLFVVLQTMSVVEVETQRCTTGTSALLLWFLVVLFPVTVYRIGLHMSELLQRYSCRSRRVVNRLIVIHVSPRASAYTVEHSSGQV